jgi:hypothetical protein
MTLAFRRLASPLLVTVGVAVLVAACSGTTSSPAASALPTPIATATPPPTIAPTPTVAPTPLPSASLAPTAAPSAATSPAGSAAACAPLPPAMTVPSDRLTDVQVAPGDTTDNVRFVFGNPSLPGPSSPPKATLTVAKPPYTNAGSGAPIAVKGDHVLQLKLTGMSVQNDAGEPVYDGPTDITQQSPAFQEAVMYDASEGVIGWYIGYDGDGCVSLIDDRDALLLSIGQR